MALHSTIIVNDCLNRAAAEVGIAPVADPFASQDPTFIQMRYLLQTAGEELVEVYPWEFLVAEHQFNTVADQTDYELPTDFSRMINQTGWERSQRVPLGGPLSAQDWAYLKGYDLGSTTLYASFRLADNLFKIYPESPPADLDINYEYISKNWLINADDPLVKQDSILKGGDTIMFHRTLITRYLKLKFLESGGFDTTKAQDDFNMIFQMLTGSDKGAPVLNAGSRKGFPYLSMANLPHTGYGQ